MRAMDTINGELGGGRLLNGRHDRPKGDAEMTKGDAEMTKEDLISAPEPKKKRLLVVENQGDEGNLLRLLLGDYNVVAAGDYAEGLRIARRQYFDLYVLDNWTLGGTGIELCRRIREFDPNTPILFCSRHYYSGDYSEAMVAGAKT